MNQDVQSRPLGTGKDLAEAFTYIHRLRRDPRVTEEQRPYIQRKYDDLRQAMIGLASAPSAPTAVRDAARGLVRAADVDNDALEYMPSLVGYDSGADARVSAAREKAVETLGLSGLVEQRIKDLQSRSSKQDARTSAATGGPTSEAVRRQAIDETFRDMIGADLDDVTKQGYAFTRPANDSIFSIGQRRPAMARPELPKDFESFPIGNSIEEGIEAFQILNPQNPLLEDERGKYFEVTSPLTGEKKRYDVPARYASLGTEVGRAWADALAGRDPYSVDYLRLAVGETVTGRLIKEGTNVAEGVPVIGQALHAVGLDYKKGEDYDVDSLIGVVPFVPKITGDKAVDRSLLKDPIALRMLMELDGKGTFWSTLFQGAVGVADFVATQHALGKVLGLSAKAANVGSSMAMRVPFGPGKMTATMRRWGAEFAKRSGTMQWMRGAMVRGGPNSGLHFGTARNVTQEVAYGAIQGVLDPRSSFWDGVSSGMHEALIEGVMSPVARNVWRGAGKVAVATRLTSLGERIASQLPVIRGLDLRFLDEATRNRLLTLNAGLGGVAIDDLRRASGKLPSSSPELRSILAKRFRNAEVQQEIASALDIMLVGAGTYAHFAAMEAVNNPQPGSDGYWSAFQDALLSEDAIASGLGMVAGGIGMSGLRRIRGGEPLIVREGPVGEAKMLTRDEALNEAAHLMWEDLSNPIGNNDRMRFLSSVAQLIAEEERLNPKAVTGRRTAKEGQLIRAAQPSRADGYDQDLRAYMGEAKVENPFDIAWDKFEAWRKGKGLAANPRPRATDLGGGMYVEYLNQARGVTRQDPDFVFSAGEKLALAWAHTKKGVGAMRQAIGAARTVDLAGMARDLMRLPQQFTDLAPKERGATRRQVRSALRAVQAELQRRLDQGPPQGPTAPPPSPPGPAPVVAPSTPPAPSSPTPISGAAVRLASGGSKVWVPLQPLADAVVAGELTLGVDVLRSMYGLDTPAAVELALAVSDHVLFGGDVRQGPVEPDSPESLRLKIHDLAEEAQIPAGTPPEIEEGTQRAMARLAEPGFLAEADIDAEAAADVKGMLAGKPPQTDPAAVLEDVKPTLAGVRAGNPRAFVRSMVDLERLQQVEASIAAELDALLTAPGRQAEAEAAAVAELDALLTAPGRQAEAEATAVAELEGMLLQVQETQAQLEDAVAAQPLANEARAEGAQIARVLEAAVEAEGRGREHALLEEQLWPELKVLGLTVDQAKDQALEGKLDAPDWVQRLLRGEDRAMSPSQVMKMLADVVAPWRGTPEWELNPDRVRDRVLRRYVDRPASVSEALGQEAVQRSRAAAQAAVPPQAKAIGPIRDADIRQELQEAALDATIEEDPEVATALNRSAMLVEATPTEEELEAQADALLEQGAAPETDPVISVSRYQGDLFDARDETERKAFEAGSLIFGDPRGGIGGWRQTMFTYLMMGDSVEGQRHREALVNGSVYASGGGLAALELIDATYDLARGTAAKRWEQLAETGLGRNRDLIESALKRVSDATGAPLELAKMSTPMQAALGVLSLGAPLSATGSGENRIDAARMRSVLGAVLEDGSPSESELLERGRQVVLQGWPDGYGRRHGGVLSSSASQREIDQAAARVIQVGRNLMRVAKARATAIKQETITSRLAGAIKKKLGIKSEESDKLGGRTAVQVANMVVEEITGTELNVVGRPIMKADARAAEGVAAVQAANAMMLDAAAAVSRELEAAVTKGDTKEAQRIMTAAVATVRSSVGLAEEIAITLSDVMGEDGKPLIDPALGSIHDSPELRFWMRVLATGTSPQHARLRGLAAASGIDTVTLDDLSSKAGQVLANSNALLDLAFRGLASQSRRRVSTGEVEWTEDGGAIDAADDARDVSDLERAAEENELGDSFYAAFRRVLERVADGLPPAVDESEARALNHWSTSIGVSLVEERNGSWELNEPGVLEAQRLAADALRPVMKVVGDSGPVYLYGGLGLIAPWLPKWLRSPAELLPQEPIHRGYEFAVRTLDSMGLGFVANAARIPTELIGRRRDAVGKGRAERAQDVIAAHRTASARLSAEEFVVETAHAIGDYWASLPQHMRRAAGTLIDSGAWKDVRSAKHLAQILGEPHTPRVERLYHALLDYNWRILEIGRRGVLHGFIAPEQFAHFTHGQLDPRKPVARDTAARTSYFMAALAPTPQGTQHNQTVNPSNRKSRDGIFSLIGREMARDQRGVTSGLRRVMDPMVGLSSSVTTEANQLALYEWLQKAANRWGVPFTEIDKRIPKHERRAFMTAAVPLGYDSNVDPVSGRRITPVQRALADWVGQMRASEEKYMASGGTEGTRPNRRRTAMMNKLVPLDGSPGVAITRHTSMDLKFMLEQYATDGDFGSKLLGIVDGYASRWRRTRTTSRLGHITMAQVSATFSNIALGGVTTADFMRGILTNSGPYAEAGEAQALMAEHMRDQSRGLDKHPLVADYRWFMETIGNTTMVSNLVNNHALVETRNALRRMQGVPLDAVGMSGAVANATARLTASELATADGIERAVAKVLARNPSETEALVRTAELHTAHYHAAEMLHKFAAFRSLTRRYPAKAQTMAGRIDLAREAAALTGDYSNVSPWLREWTSRLRNSPIDFTYREGGERVLNVAGPAVRALLAVPFLGFVSVMTPTAAGAMLRHQGMGAIRMAAATAFLAGGMMAVMRMLAGDEEQERTQELLEAAKGTRLRSAGEWTRETSDLWRSRNGGLVPRSIGPISFSASFDRSIERAAHVFLGRAGQGTLMVNAAPDWYGRGALIDTTHFLSSTPFEFALRMAKDVGLERFARDAAEGRVVESAGHLARAMLLSDSMQGWTTQHTFGLITAAQGLWSGIEGTGGPERVAKGIEWIRDQFAADLNPLTAAYSKTSQHFFEATALRGTPISEAVLGIRRGETRSMGAGQRMAGAALRAFLPVQEIPARRAMVERLRSTPERLADAIIAERYPNARDVSGFTEDHKALARMAPLAKRAFSGMIRALYERARMHGSTAEPLHQALGNELRFLTAGVEESKRPDGSLEMRLRHDYKPNGELAHWVARQSGLDQEYAIRLLRDMVLGMGDRLPTATTALHRALEENAVEGSVAMRIWEAIAHPSPARVLEIIAEDMRDPRNHYALSHVWQGVEADLAEELGEESSANLPAQRLFLRLRQEFESLDIDEGPPPKLGTRAADVMPGALLR